MAFSNKLWQKEENSEGEREKDEDGDIKRRNSARVGFRFGKSEWYMYVKNEG